MEGAFVTLSIPSGANPVEIAMTPHEAIHLARAMQLAAIGEIEASRPEADLIPFGVAGGAA
jgi:hypothetical protein